MAVEAPNPNHAGTSAHADGLQASSTSPVAPAPSLLPANIVRLFPPTDPRARMACDWAEALRRAGTPIEPPEPEDFDLWSDDRRDEQAERERREEESHGL